MVKQKALVGKLTKFAVGERRIFTLSNNFLSLDEECLFFHPVRNDTETSKEVNTGTSMSKTSEMRSTGLSQTYPQWKVMLDFQILHSFQKRKQFKQRTMYILPMGTLEHETLVNAAIRESGQNRLPSTYNSLFDILVKFTSLFFCGMDVEVLEFQNIEHLGFTTRIHERTSKEQVLVSDVLNYLKKVKPKECFCIVAWSWLDLYPCTELNFVLGEASFETGCAVISCGHYSAVKPNMTCSNLSKDASSREDFVPLPCFSESLLFHLHGEGQNVCRDILDNGVVWRVLKVLTHEVCHLVGMHHCTFFSCLMNESNNVYQAENQPIFLCPICLRKLQKFLKFSVEMRYRSIKDFMEHYCCIIRAERHACGRHLSQHSSSEPLRNLGDDNSFSDTKVVNLNVAMNVNNIDSSAAMSTLDKFGHCVTWLDSVLVYMNK